jgi:A/G-specific adenine glycosylase
MAADLVSPLVAWYRDQARELPWRGPEVSPWGVLVSEIMLQQTPVARVEPSYLAWMSRWPHPRDLAAEPSGEAVRMWGKLGYPRRALRLHEAARAIADRHGGQVPTTVPELLALPGVGTYTAHAVATFAFGQRHPVVDTNVRRVVARAVLAQGDAGPPSPARDLALVAELLPALDALAAEFSIALMELGALVCVARGPRCGRCPLQLSCAWIAAGSPPYDGNRARPQRFAGTDRQVRGRLMDVLRQASGPVPGGQLDVVWPDPVQRARALDALIADGLIDPLPDGRFALPS